MTIDELNAAINALPSTSTNVTTALERIKGLRDILARHGLELDLQTPDNSKLELIVREYNKIAKQVIPGVSLGVKPGAITVDNLTYVEVSAGYYTQPFYITGANSQKDINDALEALKQTIQGLLPSPEDVVAGANTIVIVPSTSDPNVLEVKNVVGVAGSLDTSEKDYRLDAKGKDSDNNLVLVTTTDKELHTTIPYNNGGEVEVQVIVKEGATLGENPEKVQVLEVDALPSGYYADQITIIPVLNKGDNTNKAINVQTNKEVIIQHAGLTNFEPGEGFDYIKNGIVKVPEGASKVTAEILGNAVKLTPTLTEGWISETSVEGTGVTKSQDGSYIIALSSGSSEGVAVLGSDDYDEDFRQEAVVTIPAGIYDGTTTLPVVIKNGDSEKDLEYISVLPDIQVDDITGNPKLVVPTGVIVNPIEKNLNKSEIAVQYTEIEDATTLTINSKIVYVSSNEGYTFGEAKKLVIKDATTPTLSTTKVQDEDGEEYDAVVINVESEGWIDAKQIDVSADFKTFADQYANGLVDRTDEFGTGEVLFTYEDNLDETPGGIQLKSPVGNSRYFTRAKVDLSALITDIDNI